MVVSDQTLERARKAMDLLGITPAAIDKLVAFDGNVTIGVDPVRAKAKSAAASRGPKRGGSKGSR